MFAIARLSLLRQLLVSHSCAISLLHMCGYHTSLPSVVRTTHCSFEHVSYQSSKVSENTLQCFILIYIRLHWLEIGLFSLRFRISGIYPIKIEIQTRIIEESPMMQNLYRFLQS